MSVTLAAVLERAAQKKGADRYSVQPVLKDGEPWAVYIPQEFSRPSGGSPVPALTLTINAEAPSMSVALATIQGIITRHDEGLLSYEEALSQIYAEATKALMVLYPGEEGA